MSSENNTPQTGQTVQEEPEPAETKQERNPFWEVANDEKGEWSWVLWSANGREMARSSITYPRRKDAVGAIKAIAAMIPKAKLVLEAK